MTTDEPAHDILAAEAFALGEGDPQLHQEPAHDVLAAEEFALPAPERHAVPPEYPAGSAGRTRSARGPILLAAIGVAVLLLWLRRR